MENKQFLSVHFSGRMETSTRATQKINTGSDIYQVTANSECGKQFKKLEGVVSLNPPKCQSA